MLLLGLASDNDKALALQVQQTHLTTLQTEIVMQQEVEDTKPLASPPNAKLASLMSQVLNKFKKQSKEGTIIIQTKD
jgi:hypothetical protein